MSTFERAQREYENRMPPEPDWVGEEEKNCDRDDVPFEIVGKDGRKYIVYAECPFEDKVEVMIGNGVAQWTCPVCESRHEDDATGWDEDPDPDRYYEEMRDRQMGLE
jgi:hypothetical protein